MKIIEILQSKLKDVSEDELSLLIAEVEQVVKNYCNIRSIPEELNFTVANMVVDLYNKQNESDGESAPLGSVISIKEGDATVQFGAQRKELSQFSMESILYSYKEQLNIFRKIRW
ncbi:hypothetical protein BEP19_09840 [Ammoniphilus oxalaticus]|uniref:DNA-packaging protein n=1 Tax=Ammoniphilus oxalaticus TaxID=66863 RepID=A0A419SFI8_9BACL|nr:hypothetical protein [Ammoniphilus oxalaticus]RKD22553.1 hypothetical protein BEP19_09840 [Ammoniphilus oxalaticus]